MTARHVAIASLAIAWLVAGSARAQPASPPPATGDVEEARRHYARGVELYDQHADAAALAELERAYQLAPNWKVLYELGVVELAVHDFAAALGHFEQYLDEGKDGVTAARRREVGDRIAQLRQDVATITISTAAGAEIKLDDVAVGTAPLPKPLVVNPGHHKLGASKDGLVAESRVISAAGGDSTSVELVIAAPPPPPPPPPPVVALPPSPAPEPAAAPAESHVDEPRYAPPPYPLWAGWLATGVLASGAIVTGLEALSANSSLTSAKSDGPTTPASLASLSSRAHAFAAASDVMTGVAVLAGGATLYFALRPATRPTPTAAVSLGVGFGRLSLEGTF